MNDMPVFGPDQVSTKTALEDIAIETGTPIEVLFAAGEQAGAQTPDDFLRIARERGQQIGPRFKAGEDPTAIVTELFGPEAQRSFGDYATEIRAQLYGTPTVQQRNQAELDNEGIGGTLKRRGQQFVRGLTEPFAAMPEAAAIAQAQTDNADTPAADMEGFARGQQMRDSVEGTFGAPNPEDRSFWGMVAEGAGNLVGMGGASLAAGVAGTLAAGPVGGAVAGIGTGGAIGAAMNTSQLYREARDMGADEAVAEQAARWGALIGASEIIPIARAFKYLPQGVRQKVGNGVMKRFVDIAQSAGEEAAQEYLATVANNMVAQQLYDPDRGWTEGATEAALVGAVLGGGAGAIGAGYDAYRNRQQPGPLPKNPANPNTGQGNPSAPPGGAPQPGMVPPVSGPGREPEQGVPTPTSDVLRPQAVDPLDPAGQRPAAPSPVSDVLAGAPGSVLQDFQPNQPVQLQFADPETGEISDPVEATFVGEDAAQGYASFRATDGSPLEIDTAEIASGNINVAPINIQPAAPADAPAPMQEATQAPAAAATPPIPAGVDPDAFMERVAIRQADGMSPDEAYALTLQDALDAMREDVGTIAADVEDRQRQDRENQSRIDEAVFTDDRGQPVVFPTEASALGRLGAGYTVEPFGGGFIGVRQQEVAANEGNANDGVGGDGSPAIGGGVITAGGDADRAPIGDGGGGAALGPVEQGAAQGVADATGDADGKPALTGEQKFEENKAAAQNFKKGDRVQYVNSNFNPPRTFTATVLDPKYIKEQGMVQLLVDGGIDGNGYDVSIGARQLSKITDQNPIKQNAPENQGVAPVQPETAPADQETDPIRAAVRDAIASGPVQHTTVKGKVLDGYILKGMTPAQVKQAFDTGAFTKDGGTFIRKDRAEAFLGAESPSASVAPEAPAAAEAPQKKGWQRIGTNARGNPLFEDERGVRSYTESGVRLTESVGIIPGVGIEINADRRGRDYLTEQEWQAKQTAIKPQAEKEAEDLAAKIEAAAAETDPNPTEAQKEAENYKTGKIQWNGLTLSIENAKGSERSKKTPDGKTQWSVTMPAHYGRILRTEGADGDHVDFYMGDVPDSDYVLIVNQVDPETQQMDEHKVIIGTTARGAALGIYRDGFSDGSGNSRIGSFTETNVANLKAWLASGETKAPTQPIDMPFAKRKAETKPTLPVKTVEIPAVGFLRPGYERVMVKGEPSTDQTRMTDDGYVVVRQINKTTIRGPQGQVIWAGAYDVDEATVDAEIGKARKRRANDETRKPTWADFDERSDNDPKMPEGYELTVIRRMTKDEAEAEGYQWPAYKAVVKRDRPAGTYKVESGISENSRANAIAVALERAKKGAERKDAPQAAPTPTPAADNVPAASPAEMSADDILNAAFDDVFGADPEAAPQPEPEQAPQPEAETAALPESVETALSGQIDKKKARLKRLRSGNKPGVTELEAEIRKMRQEIFNAEDAAAQAVAQGDPSLFAPYAEMFPDAAEAISDETPVAAPRAPRTAGEAAKSAASNAAEGIGNIVDGLNALFGGPNKLSSGLTFDAETYAKAKPMFIAAVRAFGRAGQDIMDMARAMVRGLSANGLTQEAQENMRPYLTQFINDMRDGTVDPFAEDVQAPAEGGNVEADQPEAANDAEISTIRRDPAGAPESVETEGARPDGEGGDSEPGRAGKGNANSGGGRGPSGPRISGARGPRNRPRPTVSEAGGLNLGVQQSVDQSEAPIANFTITPELRLGQGGPTEKFNDNLAAITTLKQIEAENRRATPAEQAILARYVGWGGLKNAFRAAGSESIAKGWEGKVEQVEELLDPAELRAARASTRAAHYTSQTVVNGVWKLAQRLGFDGGSVLEPSAGTGNFLGLMPEDLRDKSKVLAVEYDSITARIAKQLYPQSTVLHSGFQDVPLPANKFALAIGNPPFGNESLYFQHLPSVNRRTIHNQFFQASLNSVEPGGIMVMVVSRYLMDARNTDNRAQLARQGELVAAMRLPSSAFQENARTEVVTDILAFRKHSVDQEIVEHALQVALGTPQNSRLSIDTQVANEVEIARLAENFGSWLRVSEFADPAGSTETLAMNDYYQRNPAMVLGDISATGTMRRANELNVTLPASEIEARIDRAISRVPQVQPSQTQAERTRASFDALSEAMSLAVRGAEAGAVRLDEDGRLIVVSEQMDEAGNGTLRELELTADTPFSADYYLGDDGKWRREVDQLDDSGNKVKQRKADGTLSNRNVKITQVIEDPADIPTQSKWGAKRIELMRDMLPIRDGFRKQVGLESQIDASEGQVEASRKALKDAYDAFVAKHGFLHEPKTRAVADTMPDGGLILAVEDVTSKRGQKIKAKPADILSKRVLMPPEKAKSANTLADAITISLIETAGIDVERIAELRGQTVEQIEAELSAGENPRGFYDPELSKWVTADEYLSGEVRRKLAAAEAAGMDTNIAALSKVAPAPWGAGEITPSLGANWIPTKVYGEFLRHLGYSDAGAVYSKLSNTFTLRTEGDPKDQWVAQEDRAWSTAKIVEAVMNSSGIRITYTVTDADGSERTFVDEDATRESQEKAEELQTEFQDWVFSDDERTNQLVEIFNNRFNTRVTRQRDGSHLTLPGASPHVNMRRHQNNAIWRGITDNVVLYDHVVGAGKTFVAIARIMERKRLGLTRKPLVVVPNHVTEQWAAEWKELYPGAKLLVAGKDDMAQKNRRRLFARIASGDYDGIIIGHSQITMIPIDRSIDVGYLEQELKAAIEAVAEAEEVAQEEGFTGFRKPPNVAEAERLVTKIEQRLAALRSRNQDRLINFQQMGIDDITVDEAHEFKNLNYSSRLTGTAGMGNKAGSNKALDLHLKLRSMHDAKNSIAFLTGTPISNSAAEMYLVLRNLAPKELEAMGLMNFDAWRTMFVTARAEYEPTEAGSIKQVTRLGREWTNMRTLMDLYYSVSDAVTLDDLKEDFRRDNPGEEFPVPKVLNVKEGETRLLKTIKPGPASTRILNDIVSGFNGLPNISDPKERNAERLRLMDRARKVALDPRAVDPNNEPDESGGKIKAIVGEASRIYRKWDDDKGTQIIFLDRSVPKAKGDEKIVAEYDAAIAKYEDAVNEGDQTKIGQAVEALEKYDVQDMEARRAALQGGWNAYDEIKRQLVAEGIPENEIAFVQDANNDVQKAILFEKVNSGEIRIIIGSTPRMGAGTNIQERLVALHHADVTWKPSDIEQREGRIIRQKNSLLAKYGQDGFGVEVIAYATERTVDAKMWDLNGQKLKSINGIRKYDGSFFMEFEDADSASMAEMAAIATGNPLMVDRIKLEDQQKKLVGKLRRFNRAKNGHRSNLAKAERIISQADATLGYLGRLKAEVERQAEAVAKNTASRSVTIAGKPYSDPNEAVTALADAIEAEKAAGNKRWRVEVEGVEVTNQDDAHTLIRRNLGTSGFVATVDGREYIDIQAAAQALAEAYNKARAEQDDLTTQSFNKAKVNGFPFEIVVAPDSFTRKFQAEAVLLFEGDAAFTRFTSLDNTLVSTAQFRSMLERLTDQADPKRIEQALANEAVRIEEATRSKPELEKLLQQDFPEAQQLADVETRLDDVIAALEGGANASDQDEADGAEMRGDTPAADPAFTEDARRAVTKALQAEVAKVLPGKRVSVSLVRALYSLKDGTRIMGRANRDGSVQVSERMAGDGAGALGILYHEIVHVLRDAGLWRSEYGLFERGEWERLVRKAEADAGIVASVNKRYAGKGLTREQMQEEYVAEMYRLWKQAVDGYSGVERILLKIEDFFRALASALRGQGFDSAGRIMQRIADGTVGGRDPSGPGRGARADMSGMVPAEMRGQQGSNADPVVNPSVMASIARLWSPKPAGSATAMDKKEAGFVSNLLTNAMASNDQYNSLGLVPGEVLFRDLAKNLPSAGKWVKTMRQMTAERQEMHAEADVLAREWQGLYAKDKANGRALHDLMHESTIEAIDPSERFRAPRRPQDMSDAQYMNFVEDKRAKHGELRDKFRALPEKMQDIYRRARDAYREFDAKLIDAMVDAVVKAMDLQAERLKARYEAELQQFSDDGLEGDALKEAKRKARSRFNQDVKMLEFSRNARIRKMRLTYESNRIEGPYFPLMRFGQFFIAARNEKGKLMHFERTSTAGAQQRIANEMRAQGFVVETGVMKPEDNISRFVDPNFVADITEAMGEAGADSQILDAIYQRYLETLPSFSIRKANIHRQGVPGFDKDAIRAFGNRMFHGAHQLTRLRHAMDLTKYIESARREAKRQADPVRAGALVNEMQKRHDWSMNPQGAEWSAWATSAAFVWYLGLTPAAAITNISQTTVVGIPILAAGIKGGTVAKAAKALSGALADFTAGLKKGDKEWSRGALTSGRLSEDERKALQAAYLSGALDKSQAHDIAAIGESGAEYSPIREKVMRPIAFLFHHAERLNREVTFLAAYRMAKESGMDHDAATIKAGDLTWDTHFNYENWSRPRFMQGDVARVIFTFRQFQVNMLYRLFRDTHQALKGESPEVRKQARAQLIGITASMMAHAGITGTWGYALIMLLAGMFMEGGSEEAEEELKSAIVGMFGPGAGGLLLKGIPGHLTGTDMTARMGMPELWFRSPDRQLEGKEAYNYLIEQMLGPVFGIGASVFRGASMVGDGEVWRGTELMVPKAIRDQLRFVRYMNEGVTTYKGDPLLDDVSAHDAIKQAIGFSPARVSERYEQNRRLMNEQRRIEDERRAILADVTRYLREGKEVSPRAMRKIDEFNAKYPTFPINGDTIRRSLRARANMTEQMDGGLRLNPKLDRPLREGQAPSIYNG